MSIGSPLCKSLFDQKDPHNELAVRKSMSLHKKALGLNQTNMMDNAYGSGHGMQLEVLEHRFKEIEKKLDNCATEYRKTLIKD